MIKNMVASIRGEIVQEIEKENTEINPNQKLGSAFFGEDEAFNDVDWEGFDGADVTELLEQAETKSYKVDKINMEKEEELED